MQWCPTRMSKYLKTKSKKLERRAEEIFLNRVLAYARKKEEEEETKRSNEECIIPQVPEDPPVQNKEEQQHIDEQQQSDSDADTTGAEDCNGPVSSDRKTEPIKPGDVIEYYTHQFVSGDKRGHRRAVVLSVDPKRFPVLVLDNSECLPKDTQIKRILVFQHRKHVEYDGIYRPVERYKLRKLDTPKALEGTDAAAGFKAEIKRVGEIVKKQMSKLQEDMKADGSSSFGYMLHKYGKGGGKKRKEETISDGNETDDKKKTLGKKTQTVKKQRIQERRRSCPNLQVKSTTASKRNNTSTTSRRSRRSTISTQFLSESQLELASDVKKFLRKQHSGDTKVKSDDDDTIQKTILDKISDQLDISAYRLEKFLQGDEQRLVSKRMHEETETILRKWYSNQEAEHINSD
mmetsp:Transcript_11975/g.17728  ORF Transcript_11975/g.17728 Transcript_11975/m.17728 type:complete len:404 (+) Transcript_11975:938-2149(+)